MSVALAALVLTIGAAAVIAGAELFAEHVSGAAVRLGVSVFALALLLAGAEPEELATVVTASLRHAPAVGIGDVIGANASIALLVVGFAALLAPLVLRGRVRTYAFLGLPLGVIAVVVSWDGRVSRLEGSGLVALYGAFVALVWRMERHPPALGEVAELAEAERHPPRRIGVELMLAAIGIALMTLGSIGIVEAVKSITDVEVHQAALGVTLVGFVTSLELVALAWSATRRDHVETALAGIVGSFAYNATMSLGAGALARPLVLSDTGVLHVPMVLMPCALVLMLGLAGPAARLDRRRGAVLVAAYAAFVVVTLVVVR